MNLRYSDMKKAVAALLIIFAAIPSFACTSAIFTGKSTPDGRPLLWKHRDTGDLNNRMEYFAAGGDVKYSFIGLVTSPSQGGEVWMGTNETGFSIMNTASYNLQTEVAKTEDMEGVMMYKALSSCRTLADFEKMVSKMPKPYCVEANFGVIDAEGGAAYYEINNTSWTKVDANDPKIAPEGFLIYTNHSYTGRLNEGSGYIRYANATTITYKHWIAGGEITPQWIYNSLSRSFYNSLLDIDLKQTPEACPNGWFVDQDFIPRRSTSASCIVKGVKKGENPNLTVMWTVLGYPPCGVAVPMFVAAGENQPAIMLKGAEGDNCDMCDQALARRAKVFALQRSNAKGYFNVAKALEYIEKLAPCEAANFEAAEQFMAEQYKRGSIDKAGIQKLYSSLSFGEDIR